MTEARQPLTFYDLRHANIHRQQLWEQDGALEFTDVYYGNALAGEVGEACNVIKKLERERLGAAGSRATRDDLAEELADVLIYVDLLAAKFDIDLDRAVTNKFNKTSRKLGFGVYL